MTLHHQQINMPIDLSLLHDLDDGGNIPEVIKWFCKRNPDVETTEFDSILSQIKIFQSRKKEVHHTLLIKRKTLNIYQKQLTSINKVHTLTNQDCKDDLDEKTLINEIKELKLLSIPSLTRKLEKYSILLHNEVPKIPNLVDEAPFLFQAKDEFESQHVGKLQNMKSWNNKSDDVIDPLRCIEAYETVHFPYGTFHHERCILVRIGSNLASACTAYAKSFFITHLDKNYHNLNIIQAPENVPLSKSMAHDVMGCTLNEKMGRKCNICSQSNNQSHTHSTTHDYQQPDSDIPFLPPFIMLCMMKQNNSFPDKYLPQQYILEVTKTEASLDKTDIKTFLRRPLFAHPTPQIDYFSMCTCNLSISRKHQDEVAEMMMNFYNSLLIKSDVLSKIYHPSKKLKIRRHNSREDDKIIDFSNKRCSILRSRVTPSTELDYHEARRIVIEGYLPSAEKYIKLGHVSNSTDYISRAFKMKCGGSNDKTSEFTHLIHGTLFHVDGGCLEWVVENNIVSFQFVEGNNNDDDTSHDANINHDESLGVLLPSSLSSSFSQIDPRINKINHHNQSFILIPFTRTITRGKAGKLIVKEVTKSMTNTSHEESSKNTFVEILQYDNGESNIHHQHQQRNVNAGDFPPQSTTTAGENEVFIKGFNITSPTTNDILNEDVCNPFDFLPLYVQMKKHV